MKLKTGTWVVVADGARGLILVNDGTALEPRLRVERTYAQDNPKTSAQGRDKPARTYESTGSRRSSAEVPDLHQRAEDDFVRNIMSDLEEAASAGKFEHAVVIAPPVALGEMRKSANKDVTARIAVWIDKDLTKAPVSDITSAVVKALEG